MDTRKASIIPSIKSERLMISRAAKLEAVVYSAHYEASGIEGSVLIFPRPARSYAQLFTRGARRFWTRDQPRDEPAPPASRIMAGPLRSGPTHRTLSLWPPLSTSMSSAGAGPWAAERCADATLNMIAITSRSTDLISPQSHHASPESEQVCRISNVPYTT